MRTVAQITTELTPYLAVANRNSAGTSILAMLNLVLPRLYSEGDWDRLLYPYEVDAVSGYFCLPPEAECITRATLNSMPIDINDQIYEYQIGGPGQIERPVGHAIGLIDQGYRSLMSEIAEEGADEFIFTSNSAFASGDTVLITYEDTDAGYTQVTLPLHTISIVISGAADGGSGLTDLTVTSSAGLVAGLGLTITQLTGTDATYISTFRIASVPDATSVIIVKDYVALTGTIAGASTPRLMPESTIASVESLVYTSLPAKTWMKDADGITYAILSPGSGAAEFRRYEVPQVPPESTDEWPVECILKRKFIPLTASTDLVYLDNLTALRYAFQAACYEDEGDSERAHVYWGKAIKSLNDHLADKRGGAKKNVTFNPWGEGVSPLPCRY